MGATKKYKLKRVISGGTNNASTYWGKFTYTKKDGTKEDVTLTENYEVIKGNLPLGGKKIFKVGFRSFGYEHEIIVDADNKQQQLFLEALRLDPKVHSIGSLKTGNIWHLVDENYEAIQVALEIKKRAAITNHVYALSKAALAKLCYFLNENIVGKSKETIYGMLLHPISGKIFSRPLRAENNYVDTILNGAFGSDYDVRSSVNKAVILKVINHNNGAYYFGNTIVGTTIDSVYAFFRENQAVFNSGLLPELDTKDFLPESIDFDNELEIVEEDMKNENANTPFLGENGKLTPEKRAELLKRAEELKTLGFRINGFINNFSDAVLVQKVTEAENKLAAKQNL
jgi:hypothetical protein